MVAELRIGTRERELAMAALDEHLRAGRLEAAEYGERSATASTAHLRSELDVLFDDLPEPHPVYPPDPARTGVEDGRPGPPLAPAPSAAAAPVPSRGDRELPELEVPLGAWIGRHATSLGVLVPVVVIALEALIGFRFPLGFLLIPLALAGLGWLGHRHGG